MSGTDAAPYTTSSSLLVYLEVLQEARDGPETVAEDTIRGEVPPEPQEAAQRRSSWWRWFFGFD